MLRDLVDIIAKIFSTFKRSWRTGELLEDCRKAKVTSAFRKGNKQDPGQLASPQTLKKCWNVFFLDVISKHMEERITRSCQHGLIKGKSWLTSLIVFYNGMTG